LKHYRSSIPKTARERITATWITGPQKYKAKYLLNRKVVGIRYFHETGEISREQPLKNALVHGIVYRSDEPGKLLSAEPYRNGLPHGVAKQWSDDGKLMGTYSMKHGTGLDLWWQDYQEGPPHLAEARYLQHGSGTASRGGCTEITRSGRNSTSGTVSSTGSNAIGRKAACAAAILDTGSTTPPSPSANTSAHAQATRHCRHSAKKTTARGDDSLPRLGIT